jgi:Flp pilus assembly protein TadG
MPVRRVNDRAPRTLSAGREHGGGTNGQAIIEFALVSVLFFSMIFGIVDFGRAIYLSNQLHNAVREGARYGKLYPTATSSIKSKVVASASGFSLSNSDVTVTCPSSCTATSSRVTVSVTAHFTAITQELLGLDPITMTVSSSANVE